MSNSPFVTLFEAFFSIIGILIILYVGHSLFNFLPTSSVVPSNTYAPANTVFNYVSTLYDNSFLFILIFAMVIDLAVAWYKPNVGMGIVNFILLFVLAYFSLSIYAFLAPINTALNANTLLPNTYAFFSNGWYIVLTFFAIILSIIFNFRKEPDKGNKG